MASHSDEEGGEIGGVKVGLSENEEEKLIQKKSADHDTVWQINHNSRRT